MSAEILFHCNVLCQSQFKNLGRRILGKHNQDRYMRSKVTCLDFYCHINRSLKQKQLESFILSSFVCFADIVA